MAVPERVWLLYFCFSGWRLLHRPLCQTGSAGSARRVSAKLSFLHLQKATVNFLVRVSLWACSRPAGCKEGGGTRTTGCISRGLDGQGRQGRGVQVCCLPQPATGETQKFICILLQNDCPSASAQQRDRRHCESGSAQSSPCCSSGRTTLVKMIAISDWVNITEDNCKPACAAVTMPRIKLGVIAWGYLVQKH